MARFYDEIPEWLFEWIQKQQMFWVASAPLSIQGHVNVSPKGTADCFHVVNSKQVWYEDLTGSGIETISHVRENGRITIMFCAFDGPPRIVRLWGYGIVHEYGTPEYNSFVPAEARKPGSRAAIVIDVYQASTSCGFAVPLYDFVMHRTQLLRSMDKKEAEDRHRAGSNGEAQSEPLLQSCDADEREKNTSTDLAQARTSLRGYWLQKNMRSLDDLPGLATAPDAILSVLPQSRFDRDARPMMRHVNGVVKDSRESVTVLWDSRVAFALGFTSGAIAMFASSRFWAK